LAAELCARRYDIGAQYGLLTAQLALALAGRDRDEVLTTIVELLASRKK
jgi:UTP-glucose-1-phosphate uridylyltransferase